MNVPTCSECIYANEYIPLWCFPYITPRCSISHNTINSNDVCCEYFDNGKSKPHVCRICGVNISDLDGEEYCEHCKKKVL